MRELGSTIECYRGETFNVIRSFVNENDEPLYLKEGVNNPFIRFTVLSNTYKIDGSYRKNYWLDLSDFPMFKGIEQFPNNEIPPNGIAVEMSEDQLRQAKSDVTIKSTFHRESETYQTVGPPSNAWTFKLNSSASGQQWKLTLNGLASPLEPYSWISFKFNAYGIRRVRLSVGEKVGAWTNYDFPASEVSIQTNETKSLSGSYYLPQIDIEGTGISEPNITIGNMVYKNTLDTDYIYYIINQDGEREYYYYKNNEWTLYSFTISKRLYNYDTKKWIGQLYQYEIALCTGELTTDWLKRVYRSLYSDYAVPSAESELAHYICKKRPDLLEGVNINEPLISYDSNTILLKNKLIVKEN